MLERLLIWNIRCTVIAVLIALMPQMCIGQTIDYERNWYKEIGRRDDYNSRFVFKRYSESDVVNAKKNYLGIFAGEPLDEWEGTYFKYEFLGHSEFAWSSTGGFVWSYVYHTLGALDYGRIVADESTVRLRLRPNKYRLQGWPSGELIKVKFGNTHLLVQPKYLRDFALVAAGLDTSLPQEFSYWTKSSEIDKKVFGLPNFPEQYASIIRSPIGARIINPGLPTIYKDCSIDGTICTEKTHRMIAIDVGRNRGVRKGMSFLVDELEERIEIINVRNNKAIARLTRWLEEDLENCWKYEHNKQIQFTCRPVRVGMTARTLSDSFDFSLIVLSPNTLLST